MARGTTQNQPDAEPEVAVEPQVVAAAPSSDALRLGTPPGPEAQPGKPLETGGQGKVTVRTRWPVDRFEHGLKGVPPITAQGVEVERSSAEQLVELAAANGIELEEAEK